MSTLRVIWSVENDETLNDDERADAIAQLKASEWSLLEVPVTIEAITITSVTSHGAVVEFTGIGGTLDWPLRLVNAPIGVVDADGPDVDATGQAWRVDLLQVLTDILQRFQP
jgi:hypothetical protein